MTCSVSDVVEHIQCQLNDPKGRRYTSDKVLGWLNLGWIMVHAIRPDLFAVTKEVQLVQGSHQNFCEQGGCSRITKILYTVGNDCVLPEQEDDDDDNTDLCEWLDGEQCLPVASGDDNGEYAITTYSMDAEQPCYVRVKPPVPDNSKTAMVSCVPATEPLCMDGEFDDAVCNRLLPCLVKFVMSEAMTLNVSSQTAHGKVSDYLNMFYACMNAIREADYALEVKNYYVQGADQQ